MPSTTLRVTGTWIGTDGTPLKGRVEFEALEPRYINGDIVRSRVVAATLDKNGSIDITLIRCISGYEVSEIVTDAPRKTYALPDSASDVNLDTFGPIGPAGPGPARLTVSTDPPPSPQVNDLWVDIS